MPTDGGPVSGWINATANLANMPSECGNLQLVSAKPDMDMLITGVSKQGLWASRDGGKSWSALGTGPGSASITNRITAIVYDPTTPARFWESGIYNGGGVYVTQDDGVTVTALGNITHSDLVSVDFSDPARKTLLAGGHEQSQTLRRSTDGGATWNNVGGGLPANTNCTSPFVVDAMTHLVGCGGYGGGPTGIWRTVDGGTTWSQVTASGGAGAPLHASDGSIYWSSPGGAGLTRSTDQGQHWTDVAGAGVIAGRPLVELPNHWLATLGPSSVVVSKDLGATWSQATNALPYSDAVGVTYSGPQKAFFVWHFTCFGNTAVPADAIMRFDWDYTQH
jgi:photosystem II stability/assembly factor-like uncharacterized protein